MGGFVITMIFLVPALLLAGHPKAVVMHGATFGCLRHHVCSTRLRKRCFKMADVCVFVLCFFTIFFITLFLFFFFVLLYSRALGRFLLFCDLFCFENINK